MKVDSTQNFLDIKGSNTSTSKTHSKGNSTATAKSTSTSNISSSSAQQAGYLDPRTSQPVQNSFPTEQPSDTEPEKGAPDAVDNKEESGAPETQKSSGKGKKDQPDTPPTTPPGDDVPTTPPGDDVPGDTPTSPPDNGPGNTGGSNGPGNNSSSSSSDVNIDIDFGGFSDELDDLRNSIDGLSEDLLKGLKDYIDSRIPERFPTTHSSPSIDFDFNFQVNSNNTSNHFQNNSYGFKPFYSQELFKLQFNQYLMGNLFGSQPLLGTPFNPAPILGEIPFYGTNRGQFF